MMTNPSPLDEMDRMMVAMFRQGDQRDYHKLYNKYAPAMLGVLKRTLGDVQLAEECVQTTFCEIWKQRLTYNPEKERLFTWMLKISRGCAVFAPFAEKKSIDEEIREEIDLVYATDIKLFLQQKSVADGAGFAAGINRQIKEAIHLIYFKGCSFASAAEQLGISVDALRGDMIRTIKQLKGAVIV